MSEQRGVCYYLCCCFTCWCCTRRICAGIVLFIVVSNLLGISLMPNIEIHYSDGTGEGGEWHRGDGSRSSRYSNPFPRRSDYDILGVRRGATADEIKDAYRQMALRYHPDKNPGCVECPDQFMKITDAYQRLRPDKRHGRRRP